MQKRYPDGSWCQRVPGKSPKLNPSKLDNEVGDGRWGYATRPQKDNTVEIETQDEVGVLHKTRGRIKPRKLVNDLATRAQSRGHNRLAENEVRMRRPRFRARKGQSPANCRGARAA